jgi:tetratricopeptide (TPR) repeat protein
MGAERDNLRAALAWYQSSPDGTDLGLRLALAMDSSIPLRNWTEARGWLERALSQAEAEGIDNPPIRVRILYNLGIGMGLLGEYAPAEARLVQGLELSRQLNEPRVTAGLVERLGWVARERGDTLMARRWLEENVSLWRELGDARGLAQALNTLGAVAIMDADLLRAEALVDEALALFQEVGDRFGEGWSLNHLGQVAQLRNEFDLAMRVHLESLALFEAIGIDYPISEANLALGQTALAIGDAYLAAKHFSRALAISRRRGFRPIDCWCLAGLAGVAFLDEDPERAARLWGAAESLRQSLGVREAPASHATYRRLMATAREQLGEAEFAAEWAAGEAMTLEEAIAETTTEN